MLGIVYKYQNKINNKVYIGSTIDEKNRKKTHFASSANNKFHKAIHYYGWINFEYEVLEKDINIEDLYEREIYYIKLYNSVKNGYNTKEKSCSNALEAKILQEKNGYHNKSLPFGYEHRNKDGNIYINENEAVIVRNIFNEYIDGNSYSKLNNKYNRYVHSILKNNKYVGNEVFPQIISKDVYDKVQSIINTSKHKCRNTLSIPIIINGKTYTSLLSAQKYLNISWRKMQRLYKDFLNGEIITI